ncbi:TraA family conjugative transfer protein [Psittacicella hinzii]|uniref:Conjugal transfer pilus assembly protein TraA n=1 Tax=Psittacicella hinzii TaxID=2028575 RepID=A0A3A1YI83_9GAMM|nr:TraA family conjugative transfer protein [Psittacicella hinzii]RIY36750.1 hypothetical protein CKF58_05740 [Psittacicella hinzii]
MKLKSLFAPVMAASLLFALTTETAMAVSASSGTGSGGGGTSGTKDVFSPLYTTLVAWTDGPLGKFIALLAILIGIAAGILRQSLVAVVIGLGAAIIFANAPTIIDAIMGVSSAPMKLAEYNFWNDA